LARGPFGIRISASNGIPTNGIPASASIYYGIKLVRVGPGKRYSFPFVGAAIAIAVAVAVVRPKSKLEL
jgi:hypothetical protein